MSDLWNRFALPLGVSAAGIALGLLWILTDVTPSMGVLAWIVFVIVGLPLYGMAEMAGEKVFSSQTGERLSRKAFSWKRVWFGLLLMLCILFIAAGLHWVSKIVQ